jgi:hypothetical protein
MYSSFTMLVVSLLLSMIILLSTLPMPLTLDVRGHFSGLLAAASQFSDDILLSYMG